MALLRNSRLKHGYRFPLRYQPTRTISADTNDLGRSDDRQAVHEYDTDLDFGGLANEISFSNTISNGLEAPHLRLRPVVDVVSGPALPKRHAVVSGGTQSFVPSDSCRAVFFPRSTILADRNDRSGLTVNDGGMAATDVIGFVGDDCVDPSPLGTCSNRSGKIGFSRSLLGVNFTAQMSDFAVSIA